MIAKHLEKGWLISASSLLVISSSSYQSSSQTNITPENPDQIVTKMNKLATLIDKYQNLIGDEGITPEQIDKQLARGFFLVMIQGEDIDKLALPQENSLSSRESKQETEQKSSLPPSSGVGKILGNNICKAFSTLDNIGQVSSSDLKQKMAQLGKIVIMNVSLRYDKSQMQALGTKLESTFGDTSNEFGTIISNDPYFLNIFQTTIQQLSNDQECFKNVIQVIDGFSSINQEKENDSQ